MALGAVIRKVSFAYLTKGTIRQLRHVGGGATPKVHSQSPATYDLPIKIRPLSSDTPKEGNDGCEQEHHALAEGMDARAIGYRQARQT